MGETLGCSHHCYNRNTNIATWLFPWPWNTFMAALHPLSSSSKAEYNIPNWLSSSGIFTTTGGGVHGHSSQLFLTADKMGKLYRCPVTGHSCGVLLKLQKQFKKSAWTQGHWSGPLSTAEKKTGFSPGIGAEESHLHHTSTRGAGSTGQKGHPWYNSGHKQWDSFCLQRAEICKWK